MMELCTIVLGMEVLGIAIAEIKQYKHDWLFVAIVFLAQFVICPFITALIIVIDKYYFRFYSTMYYKSCFLLSLIPIGIQSDCLCNSIKSTA
jgi:predicted permease